MKKYFALILISVTILTLLLSGCSKNDKPKGSFISFNLQDSPKTIDPQLTTSMPGLQINALCMEGLLRLGKKAGKIYPGGAEKWKVSKDGKVWTFQLRKDAKWSDGESVTANDYIFAFKRALSAETGAQYAYMLFPIKNAEEFSEGKIDNFSKVGIKAIDDYTLQITLSSPVPYFDQVLTFAISYPVNEKFYNKTGDNFALDKDSLLYNGPYVIKSWVQNGKINFTKNQKYWNKDNIKIDDISCLMISDYNTAANMYKNQELNITSITGDQLPMFNDKRDIHKVPDSVWFMQFNTENQYLKNKKIRQALALAVNRDVFCKNIRKDGSIPAYSFVIPDINGGEINGKTVSFRERNKKPYFSEDAKKAKTLYNEGLKELGIKTIPKLNLLLSSNDASRRDGQYIQEEIFKNLGIEVHLDLNTLQSRLQKTDQMDYDIVYRNWFPDYNDPNNFLDIWISTGANSHTGWNNSDYDRLIETANQTTDNNKRMEMLLKAEKILMTEMPIAPLFFRTCNWLIKPNIKDVVIRGFGVQVSFMWAYEEK